jgi:hypothetical protein
MELSSMDIEMVQSTGDASLDALVDDLPGDDEADESDQPAEKTRIESNPLELLEQLNNSAKTPVPTGTTTGGPAPLPAPPKPGSMPPSGKFPDLANLPTQIADDTPPPQKVAVELAPTAIPGPRVNPAGMQTMAEVPQPPVVGPGHAIGQPIIPPAGPQSSTQYAVRPSGLQAAQQMPAQPNRALPTDYPVMTGGRPFSSDLAPSTLPSHQRAMHTPEHGNAQQAMNMMTPVGDQYPQTDWDHAAAQPARALAPWQLAVLFLAVVGGALLITIIIAKIAH